MSHPGLLTTSCRKKGLQQPVLKEGAEPRARQHLPLSGSEVGGGFQGLKKGPGGWSLQEGRGRARPAAHHRLLHLHLDDVLVDVVPFILARDTVVDVLPQVMLAA